MNQQAPFQMEKFIADFAQNPEMDIPLEFIQELQNYERYVQEYDLITITKQYTFIVNNIKAILENKYLCSELQICELITNILMKFMTVRDSLSDQGAGWAAGRLKSHASGRLKNSSIQLNAIRMFPKEYVSQLTDKELMILSLSSPPDYLVLPVLSEIEKRKLSIPVHSLYNIDLADPGIGPRLFVTMFKIYVEETDPDDPNEKVTINITDAFIKRPQLHLMCMLDLSRFVPQQLELALGRIGACLMRKFPLPYSIAYFYNPAISDIVEELELNRKNLDGIDDNEMQSLVNDLGEDGIAYLVPLALEFPEWGNKLQQYALRLSQFIP